MTWRADPNFSTFKVGRRELALHREFASQAAEVIQKLIDITRAPQAGAGNRQSALRIEVGGVDLFARRARRGGMIASVLSDIYVGLTPRPLTELRVTCEAIRRGIPVAEPLGAMVEWVGPIFYRGFFLSRAIRGMTLWEFVQTDDDPTVRAHVLATTRAAIDTMNDKGLLHADLNLHNLLVTQTGDRFAVVIIDLDKARLFDGHVPAAKRRANDARLMRSIRKLDPSGKYFDAHALAALNLK